MSMNRNLRSLVEANEQKFLSEGEWDDLRPFQAAADKGAAATMKEFGKNLHHKKDRDYVRDIMRTEIYLALRKAVLEDL